MSLFPSSKADSSSALQPELYPQILAQAIETIEKLQVLVKANPEEAANIELLRGYVSLRQIVKGLIDRSKEAAAS